MTDLPEIHALPWWKGGEGGTPSLARFSADFLGRVNPIPRSIATELAARGLVGIESSSASGRLLSAALSWIARLPDLASAMYACVSHIHLLAAEAGYDVSHSEPRWPCTIFVSVPDREDEIGALRLGESIVHEAMHLHLTNRERQTRFVAPGAGMMRSPWRNEPRPIHGVLHGLYVFSCLSYFFRSLMTEQLIDVAGHAHLLRRLTDIREEVRSIDLVALSGSLTNAGTALADQCVVITVDYPELADTRAATVLTS